MWAGKIAILVIFVLASWLRIQAKIHQMKINLTKEILAGKNCKFLYRAWFKFGESLSYLRLQKSSLYAQMSYDGKNVPVLCLLL